MNKASLKEKYLIYRVRQNKDAEAYGQLYDYYVNRIFRFIFFKVSSEEIAEDITSEVFLKTWEYINRSSKKIKNFNALLYKIARNAVIDHYRTKRDDFTDEEFMEQIQDKRDLLEQVSQKIEIENIERHLVKLKDIYREVIILKYVEGFSIIEISEIIDKSKGNTRLILYRAIKALKEIIGED